MNIKIALCLAAVLLLGILTGCGQQPSPVNSAESESAQTTAVALTSMTETTEAPFSAPQTARYAPNEASVYTDYLTGGGYAKYEFLDSDPDSEYEAEAVLADVNEDGVKELLLHITNKSFLGVRGYPSISILLGITDGKVEELGYAEYGGGSGGGDYLFVRYDTTEKKHVLEYESFSRDGMFASSMFHYYYDVHQRDTQEKDYGMFGSGYVVYKTAHTLRSDTFVKEGPYAENAAQLLSETDLCTEDEDTVTANRFDDTYITDEQYEALRARFVEPTDPAYQMKPVTLDHPVPAE